MTQEKKSQHHFVPVFYLKGFCSSTSSKQLWVYDKKSGKVFSQTPKNVGYEKHYHTFEGFDGETDSNTIEDYLNNCWEGPVSRIFKEIIAGKYPKGEQRQSFANFMGLSFTRTPNYRANFEMAIAHFAKRLALFSASNATYFAKSLKNFESDTGRKLAAAPEELRQFVLKGECDVKTCPEVYLKMFIGHGIELGRVLNEMRWVILKATDRFKFLTSDNPFFFMDPTADFRSFYQGVGLASKKVEVVFPLSRELALFASWEDQVQQGFLEASHEQVKSINRRVAASSMRFVYASEKSKGLARMINKYRDQRPLIVVG